MGPPGVGDASAGVWNPGGNVSDGYSSHGSFGANMVGGNTGIYQQISVTPGVPLNISGYAAGGIGGFGNFNGVAWWEFRVMDQAWDQAQIDNGALIWKREQFDEGGFGWTAFSGQFTPTSSTITVYTKFAGWDPEWNWMYFGAYYDSIDVSPVPEPGSLLALGSGIVGLAGLVIRRRR